MVKSRFDGVAIDEAGFCEVVRDAWLVAVDAAFFGLGVAKLLFHDVYGGRFMLIRGFKCPT